MGVRTGNLLEVQRISWPNFPKFV